MSTTLRVVHTTGYHYGGLAASSFNEARMTPRSDEHQVALHSRLDITPSPWTHTYLDYWGTTVTGFEVHEPHDELRVVATSTVDVHRRTDGDRDAGWDVLRSPATEAEFAEYLTTGPRVAPAPELAGIVADLSAASPTPAEFVARVRELLDTRIRYTPGVTSVTTPASTVWENGAGVCQDLSHVLIGALRAGGVPARYVSGYVMSRPDTPVGESTVGESHAWVEFWTGSWVGVDPTNRGDVGDTHVVVGHGRDYTDVPPLRGIFTGGPAVDMFVEVSLTRLR